MRTIKKIALLVDVDNVKMGGEAFNELYEKLNEIGDVVYCKFYGYNDRKHIYLSDAIAKYGYETAPFMRYKRRFSQLDIRIIVDALKLNYTKTEIDTYCIVAGDGDLIPLLVELKTSGRMLIDVNTPYQEQNYHMFDAHLHLESLSLDAETYKPKRTRRTTKSTSAKPGTAKKSAKAATVAQSTTPTVKTPETTQPTEAVSAQPQINLAEMLQPTSTVIPPVAQKQTTTPITPDPTPQVTETPTPQVAETPTPPVVETPTPVVEEAPYTPPVVEELVSPEQPSNEGQSIDDQLGEMLRDITNRYASLDFETNDDMDKKLQLIKDIEDFIYTETGKGEGLNSSNEEVRQIFIELSGIVDDMKNTI